MRTYSHSTTPRCHVNGYAGVQQIAALDTNHIQAIERISITLRGPYFPERVLSSLTQHFARMLNVTHLHVNGNNTTPRELDMTAIAEMQQLRHLELHRIINGVYLPQGDKLSTLTYLHLDMTTPIQVTEAWWEYDELGEMLNPDCQFDWHGPSNLRHLNIQRNTSTQLYKWIAELTNLKSLRILQPRSRAPLRLPCLAHLSALTHLDISNGEQAQINMYACAHLSNLSLARLYHFHTLRHLNMLENTSTLQHLDIRKCFRLPHSAFSAIHGVVLATLRLCGLPMLFQLPSLQHAWALQELSIKTCINLECMREGIQYMTSITTLRLMRLQGLRRLPPLSHLTKLCLFDVQDTWNITNLADTIADLENLRRLRVTLECGKTTHLRFSKRYEMASKIFKDILSALHAWPKQHLRQSTLTFTDWQTTPNGRLSLWPFRAGPWHLREYCMGQSKILAFACCQHRRLGAESPVKILSENLVKVIANIFTGASNKTLEWSSRDQREQQDIESTDIKIRTHIGPTYQMPAFLRNSTIKRLKNWMLNKFGSTMGWIAITDDELKSTTNRTRSPAPRAPKQRTLNL
jgi:Leucine-rich repeat (LRR) protein